MPSFVSRLEESIFAAAWVRQLEFVETGNAEGRRWAYERSERAVELFREAEREAAKRSLPVAHVLRQKGEPVVFPADAKDQSHE